MDDDDPVELHLTHLRFLNRRPTSVKQRALALRRLERFASRPLLDLDRETLQAFVQQPSLGAGARAGAVSHARGFYKWAHEEGLITEDPSVVGSFRERIGHDELDAVGNLVENCQPVGRSPAG